MKEIHVSFLKISILKKDSIFREARDKWFHSCLSILWIKKDLILAHPWKRYMTLFFNKLHFGEARDKWLHSFIVWIRKWLYACLSRIEMLDLLWWDTWLWSYQIHDFNLSKTLSWVCSRTLDESICTTSHELYISMSHKHTDTWL